MPCIVSCIYQVGTGVSHAQLKPEQFVQNSVTNFSISLFTIGSEQYDRFNELVIYQALGSYGWKLRKLVTAMASNIASGFSTTPHWSNTNQTHTGVVQVTYLHRYV